MRARSPLRRLGRVVLGCFDQLRQPEVGKLGVAIASNQDIGGLDIAVQDAGRMRGR
jgi:hypothetical protein